MSTFAQLQINNDGKLVLYELLELQTPDLQKNYMPCHAYGFAMDYYFELVIIAKQVIQDIIDKAARITLFGTHGERYWHGVITRVEQITAYSQQTEYRLHMHSPLYNLSRQLKSQVFVDIKIEALIDEIFQPYLTPKFRLNTQISSPLSQKNYVQYQETDLEFLQRVLAVNGLTLGFTQGREEVKVLIRDHLQNLNKDPIDLHFQTAHQLIHDSAVIYKVHQQRALISEHYHLRSYSAFVEQQPTEENIQINEPAYGHWITIDNSMDNTALRKEYLRILTQGMQWQSNTCTAISLDSRLDLNSVIRIKEHPISSMNGQYRVIQCQFKADFRQGQHCSQYKQHAKSHSDFQTQLLLIPAAVPFKLPIRQPCHSGFWTGVVEGAETNLPYIDDQGCYRIRYDFDERRSAHTQASPATPMLQTHAGDHQGQHFPLYPGTRVVLAAEQGDLTQPIIVGVLANTPCLVTQENAQEHIIKTSSGHALIMNERGLQCSSAKQQHHLAMDTQTKAVTLNSQQGDLTTNIQGFQYYAVGNALTLKTDQSYTLNVKKGYTVTTSKANLQLNSGQDVVLASSEEQRYISQTQSLSFKSHCEHSWVAKQNIDLCAHRAKVDIAAKNINYAANKLYIKTKKTIRLVVGNSQIILDEHGTVRITSKDITLSGTVAGLQGNLISFAKA